MADRPTASTITDDQLEALYERLDRQDFVITEMARNYDRQTARAERAEQQLASVRAYADRDLYTGPRQVDACAVRERLLQLAALDGAQQPECAGCGDTGACAGGPCAHPDAEQTEADVQCRTVTVDGTPVHVRGTGDWTDEDARHFADVVRAAKRRYEAEQPGPGGEGSDQ